MYLKGTKKTQKKGIFSMRKPNGFPGIQGSPGLTFLPKPHFLIPVLSATWVTWIKAMKTWMNPFPGFDQKLNELCEITSLTPGVQLRLLARLVLGYVYKLTDSTILKKQTQEHSNPSPPNNKPPNGITFRYCFPSEYRCLYKQVFLQFYPACSYQYFKQ